MMHWLSLFLSVSSVLANGSPSTESVVSSSQQRSFLRNPDLEEKTVQVNLFCDPLCDLILFAS
jgi:hypothetical protein